MKIGKTKVSRTIIVALIISATVIGVVWYINKTDADIQTIVMEYIKTNHPDATTFIGEPSQMDWNKTSSEIKIGYSRYVYTSDGWTITVGHATTAEFIYEVKAENKNEGITWIGTVHDETVSETSYTHQK